MTDCAMSKHRSELAFPNLGNRRFCLLLAVVDCISLKRSIICPPSRNLRCLVLSGGRALPATARLLKLDRWSNHLGIDEFAAFGNATSIRQAQHHTFRTTNWARVQGSQISHFVSGDPIPAGFSCDSASRRVLKNQHANDDASRFRQANAAGSMDQAQTPAHQVLTDASDTCVPRACGLQHAASARGLNRAPRLFQTVGSMVKSERDIGRRG